MPAAAEEAIAFSQIYAKSYARGSRVLRSEASCLNYAKSCARGSSSLEKIND